MPTVALSCTASTDHEMVVFEIRDTNGQIPEYELAALRANEEQSLQHGSSIGLWIFNWSVAALGGQLNFHYENGNVATISPPVKNNDT